MKQILIGKRITLEDDVPLAAPTRLCTFTVDANTIEQSLDNSTWSAVTLDSNNSFTTCAPFLRSHGGDAILMARA